MFIHKGTPGDKYDPEQSAGLNQILASVTRTVTFNFKGKSHTLTGKWTLYERTATDRDTGNTVFEPRRFIVARGKTWYEDKATQPALFFQLFISPCCQELLDERGEPVLKWQNTGDSLKKYFVRNRKLEDLNFAKRETLKAQVGKYLWDRESGLGNAKLMTIASVYGIENATNVLYVEQTRAALGKLIDQNNMQSMEEFMTKVNNEMDTDIEAMVAQCKEWGILYIKKEKSLGYWKLKQEDGTEASMGMCKNGTDDNERLLQNVKDNYGMVQKLQAAINWKLQEEAEKAEKG